MPLIVHLIDFSARNSWIEDQMDFFKEKGISQGLLTISTFGEIHDATHRKGFERVQYVRHGFFGFARACYSLKEWSIDEKVYIYAHGHWASIYGSFIRSFTGIDFVLCHHQQPEFFSFLRRKMRARASIHLALAHFYLIRARKIQSFSPEVTRSLIRRRINSTKIVEIPLGINFENYFKIDREATREQISKVVKIVSVSRLAWEKRIDLAIRSVSHLLKHGVLINYSIVGEGPEESNLKDLVKELKIEKYVTFLGRREDVNEILNSSDVFFHTSLTESYGQVLMEARLTGIPIFSSACGITFEMEELKDPVVYVFYSSNPHAIAAEFLLFLKSLETQSNVDTPNPHLLYQGHEYNHVLQNVESLFHDLFELDGEI